MVTKKNTKSAAKKPVKKEIKKVLVLRTCNKDMTSHNGFKWPKKGKVICQDWDSKAQCGNGLHGLLWGIGDGGLLNWDEDAKWLVVSVDEDKIVSIDNNKVKFPEGEVIYCGNREGAIELLVKEGADQTKMVCGQASASGDYGQASASGDYGQASASGTRGQASASGTRGQASASGYQGQASASGDYGQASASGDYGQASASGDYGQASASGYQGQASAADRGTIILCWHDGNRYRTATLYVGEDGIEPNTFYMCDMGKIIKGEKVKVTEEKK